MKGSLLTDVVQAESLLGCRVGSVYEVLQCSQSLLTVEDEVILSWLLDEKDPGDGIAQ